jgi:hypothetical protein
VLTLSRRGAALLGKVPQPYQARLIAAVQRMPSVEVRRLGALLTGLTNQLEITGQAAPLFFEESPRRGPRARR